MEATTPIMTTMTSEVPPPPPSAEVPRVSRRPNYGKIHAKPLPLNTYPLPPLIPHNPMSLLHVAFVYLYQCFTQPSSHHKPLYEAHLSLETGSVHVTDESAIRALWEHGFFGKGCLSRSEPSWLNREKKRKGLVVNETSEEFTNQRREERKKFKQERARKERQIIEAKLNEERRSRASSGAPEPTTRAKLEGMNDSPIDSLVDSLEAIVLPEQPDEPPTPVPTNPPAPFFPLVNDSATTDQSSSTKPNEAISSTKLDQASTNILNQEHLQLNPSEAMFLAYGLGALSVLDHQTALPIRTSELFTLFRSHSYFPPQSPSSLQPDDPFLLSYTTYHHFRSLGWVVRPGTKFAVDWLLYLRGPVFSHAEFAVIVLPAFTDAYWRSTPQLEETTRKKEGKHWWWLHCVNRVQSHVKKSLVLCYVDVPAPEPSPAVDANGDVDIGKLLGRYKVREFSLKRWIPNRERG